MSDFRELAKRAGVQRPWLAEQTGRSLSAVSRWFDGTANAPGPVMAWLERRLADPPPVLGEYVPTPPKRGA